MTDEILVGGALGFAGGRVSRCAAFLDPTTGEPTSTVSPDLRLAGSGLPNVSYVLPVPGGAIVAGDFELPQPYLARIDSTGANDPTFTPDISGGSVERVIAHGTGYLLLGTFTSVGGESRNGFARIHADGSVDLDWDHAFTERATAMALHGTGVVVGFGVSALTGNLMRLDDTGAEDLSFTTHTFNGRVRTIYVQPGGEIVVGGDFDEYDGTTAVLHIVRFKADGSVDATWEGPTSDAVWASYSCYDIKPDSHGNLYCDLRTSVYTRVKKLAPSDGATISWAGDSVDLAAPITVTADDGVVAWNQPGSTNRTIRRFNSDGTTTTGFPTPASGVVNPSGTANIIELSDGSLLAAGSFTSYDGARVSGLVRLLADGTLDSGFSAGLSGVCRAIAQTSDGGIVAVGSFETVGAVATPVLARIKYGAVDPDYTPTLLLSLAGTPAIQRVRQDVSLGRTYITGFFTTVVYDGLGRPGGGVARLMPDGSPDADFSDAGVRFNSDPADVWDVCIDEADHSIVVCGMFTSVKAGTIARSNLAKFDQYGDAVLAWVPPAFNSRVNRVIRQPDGKFIVGGIFTTVGGVAMAGVARLNADGTRDVSFNNPAINVSGTTRQVFDLALQPDGKILVAGSFTSVGGSSSPGIARLNADGTRDATFVPSITGATLCVALADDGSIFVGGNAAVAKMDSDGTPAVWSNPFGSGDSIADIKLHSDGTVLVAGTFYRGGRRSIARLLPSGDFDPTFNVPLLESGVISATAVSISEHPAPPLEVRRTQAPFLPFESKAATFAYRAYGGDKPYTFAVRGRAPAGLSMSGGVLSGVLTTPGRYRWAVDVTDAAGDVGTIIEDVRVAPLATPVGALVTRAFGGTRLSRYDGGGNFVADLHTFNNTAFIKRVRDKTIVARGAFTTVDSITRRYLTKHGPDGTLDTGFPGLAAGTVAWVMGAGAYYSLAYKLHSDVDVQSDGKLILGVTSHHGSSSWTGDIRRLNTDGTQDNSFVIDSDVTQSVVTRVAVQDDDTLIITGTGANHLGGMVYRTDADGALDDAFLAAFPGSYTSAQRFSTNPIFSGGTYGVGDNTFGGSGRAYNLASAVFDVAVDEEGQIVVAGGFVNRNTGVGQVLGLDILASGGGFVENAFNTNLAGYKAIVNTTYLPAAFVARVFLQPNGDITVVGTFDHMFTTGDPFAAGVTTFRRTAPARYAVVPGSNASAAEAGHSTYGLVDVDRMADGRLLVVTADNVGNATAQRLFPDGTKDASFTPISNVYSIVADDNGTSGFSADGFVEMSLDAEGGEPIVPFSSDGSIYFIAGASSPPLIEVHEEFAVTDADSYAVLLYTLVDRLRVQDQATPLLRFVSLLTESVVVRDFATLVFDHTFASDITLSDGLALDWVVTVADALMVADERLSLLDALITVVSALVVRDDVIPVLQRDVNEVLTLVGTESAQILAIVEAASALVMDDDLANTMLMFGDLSSEVDFSGSDPAALLALLTEIMDTVDLGVRIRVGDDLFVGYAVNTRNAAVSQYQNFPFNSFALVGGKAYGAGPAGIYRLGGDTDDGDPIQALLRTGVVNFEELVHVPNAWIGLTSDGQMILKTVTMDKGRKKENWYRMKERPQGAPVESRFDPAKGLASTYWQWELENVDGAYFELDMLKVWPVRIGRRYSGR